MSLLYIFEKYNSDEWAKHKYVKYVTIKFNLFKRPNIKGWCKRMGCEHMNKVKQFVYEKMWTSHQCPWEPGVLQGCVLCSQLFTTILAISANLTSTFQCNDILIYHYIGHWIWYSAPSIHQLPSNNPPFRLWKGDYIEIYFLLIHTHIGLQFLFPM